MRQAGDWREGNYIGKVVCRNMKKNHTGLRRKKTPVKFLAGVPQRTGRAGMKLRSGTLTRRYHSEPSSFSSPQMMETYFQVVRAAEIARARKNGLTPKQMDALVRRIILDGRFNHTDERGEPILFKNPETERLQIRGVKLLPEEKRSRNLQPIKNRIQTWKSARRRLLELKETFPGIELKNFESSDLTPAKKDKLTFFLLTKEKQDKLRKDFEVLSRVEKNERHEIKRFSERNRKQ